MQNKNKKKIKIVKKPFTRGQIHDKATLKRSLGVFGSIFMALFIHLVIGAMLVWDNLFMRVLTNIIMVALGLGLLYANGINAGNADVTLGEIIYKRQEEGRSVKPAEVACCYNRLKPLVCGGLGVLPYLIMCLILAFTAQLQVFTLSSLPSWISTLERQPEIGNALAYYHESISMGLTDILRIVVRMLLMPFVNMLGAENAHAMLWLERFSPVLCLIYPLAYVIGYLQGPKTRTQVHTDIAANIRKKKRQEKKKIAQRRAGQPRQPKQPEQLI